MTHRPVRSGPVTVRGADEITPGTIQWLIPGRIPMGSLTMVVGRDGSAKTTFARWLASRASCGALTGAPLRTHLALAEDDPALVTAPGLLAAGADLSQIDVVTDGLWRFPRDLEQLDAHLAARRCDLVVVDPLAAAISNLGHQRAGDALRGLRRIAERHRAALVVVHHTIKRASDPGTAIAGGYNVRAACRSILYWEQLSAIGCHYVRARAEAQELELDEQTGRLCVLWPYKASYALLPSPMIFEQRFDGNPEAPGSTIGTVELLGTLEEDLDSALALDGPDASSRRERVKTGILVLLSRGPMTADELEGAILTISGTSPRTFQRARAELAEEGTIEQFQAPRHSPDEPGSAGVRCHWWRLRLPDHAPSN